MLRYVGDQIDTPSKRIQEIITKQEEQETLIENLLQGPIDRPFEIRVSEGNFVLTLAITPCIDVG